VLYAFFSAVAVKGWYSRKALCAAFSCAVEKNGDCTAPVAFVVGMAGALPRSPPDAFRVAYLPVTFFPRFLEF